ncbi:SurA N-terminal domain-containing protein [Granulosicoccus antarcticus]|uniref:Periplasmic chaperone PpiD n=1 Tax=Granulosicoccus antarcticus IMCC3135 TaxID=1192854 RepID=A0A2Z2NXI4_9GAMM|nr:SurA N-terminal domain-containing protein [Granulosicoccus antarcticus]ASJ75175.1 Peptidyl-prolyl cis-trans isomerase D [Granulosicoccus antarcticus IMCC3135]
MLLDLRETVRNSKPIKYTLITVIIIPFALVGIGSYLSGGSIPPVAEVNGQSIDQQQLEQAYQQQRQQLARMFGGQLPEAFANEAVLRDQALQQLISQQVLESEVANQKFAVGDATLGRAIRNLPAFQVDGRFDSETYQTQLRASGMSVAVFEQSFRDDTAMNQFRTGISDTSFTLPSEAERLSSLARQVRTVEGVRFDAEKARKTIEVSEEEVAAYFEDKKESYKFPERAKIRYIEIDSAAIAADIEVTEEQAKTFYDENRGSFVLPEQRSVSHILLTTDDLSEEEASTKLSELKVRVEAGESFADLAKEFSEDVGTADLGGSLGAVTPGSMDPQFEEAVFALSSEGDISEPVVSQFGVHLIKLDSVKPESGEPFEEVKDKIIADMQKDEADREYFDLREQASEQAFDNPDSLEPVSDVTGIEIKTSDWLDSDTDSGVVLSNPQVVATIFNPDFLAEELNSEVIEIGDRHVIVLRVQEHEEARQKTLDDVRDEVEESLKSERANEMLKVLQDAALSKLATGETAAAIAEGDDFATSIEQLALGRQSTELEGGVVSRVFSLPQPGTDTAPATAAETLSNGDLIALRLDAVEVPEADVEGADESVQTLPGAEPAGANIRLGGTEFEVLLESLRENADVDIKAAASS